MKKLRANVCAVTHAGRVRRENEDNYSLNGRMTSTGDLKKGSAFVQSMTEPFHLCVCDGMGGENYGDLASGIAVETVSAHASNVYDSGEDFSFAISNTLDDANVRICAEINAKGKRMGTTLAAVYAVKGKLYCVNIGDTRIYHYSNGILEQISFDHTHAQTMVDAGEIEIGQVTNIPDAKRLTRHLGVFPQEANLSPNISVIDDVDEGDVVVLCSDGLTDMLTDDDITAVLSTSESSQDAASRLVRMSLERGGKDNITVAVAFMNVEETAIFAPIAAAMVGENDADYEEEYRTSFRPSVLSTPYPDEEAPAVSPYANADARAYIKPADKTKIFKIAGIAVGVVIVLILAALIIKAVLSAGSVDEQNTTVPETEGTTYNFFGYDNQSTTLFSFTIPVSETTTEEEEETEDEEDETTKPRPTRPSTTKTPSTTKVTETTEEETEEESSETTTQEEETSGENPSEESPSEEAPSQEEEPSESEPEETPQEEESSDSGEENSETAE